MARRSWNHARDVLLETCTEPGCEYCRLGSRLVRALNQARVPTTIELLTLIRLLATTVAASVQPEDRAVTLATVIDQLHEDMKLLTEGVTPEEARH